jgi:nitrogen-specific signal transduction histidine kinase
MIATAPLLRPIKGEISKDGRLLRADEALLNLNARAGGGAGEVLGIPALYNLCALAGRLGMRLARAVKVSDQSENLELWVEALPDGDRIEISILSWRNLGQHLFTDTFNEQNEVAISHEGLILLFDTSMRLIQTTGDAMSGLSTADFGAQAADIMSKMLPDVTVANEFLNRLAALEAFAPTVTTMHDRGSILLSGLPTINASGERVGYECRIESSQSSKPAVSNSNGTASPIVLFGKHLAPVLRQPLDRIVANAETIGRELQGPIRENYAIYARDIANAARHLTALVDDLGDLEAVERADFSTAPDTIELGDLARRVAGLLALKAADHSIQIQTPGNETKISATAEFRRVLQICLNLVTNAIRYSPDGTDITINIAEDENWAMISVLDQGSGIDVDDRERIFEKFQRLDRTGDGGSGLGLYISRRLARAMGGDLTVDEASGGGAKFTLRLPKSA